MKEYYCKFCDHHFKTGKLHDCTKPDVIESSKIMKEKIGNNIKQARLNCDMSQTEFAKSIGKHSAAYTNFIENGKRNISIIDMIKIAKVLKTTVAQLIGEKEYKNKIRTYYIRDDNGVPIKQFKI